MKYLTEWKVAKNYGCNEPVYQVYRKRDDGSGVDHSGSREYAKGIFLVESFLYWLRIYADEGYMKTYRGKRIDVYRAGEFGILIKITK